MAVQGLGNFINEFKDKLGIGSSKVVGLDIGSSQLKLIEVDTIKNGYKIVKYGSVEIPEGVISEEKIQDESTLIELIKDLCLETKISTSSVCTGLAGNGVIARKLQLTEVEDDEIEDLIENEVEQYTPYDIGDASVSSDLIGENEGGGVDYMVGVGRIEVVDAFKDIIKDAGLYLKILDLHLTSITNVFEHVFEEQINSDVEKSWLIIDFGAQLTQFVVYRDRAILFSKEIDFGSVAITEEIQRQMGVTFEEAEDLKTSDDLPEEIMEIMSSVVEVFFGELRKTLEFYLSHSSDDMLSECLITGGGAQTPGLIDGLSTILEMDVNILNPFERIAIDNKRFDQETINDIAYTCVAAIGFAMRSGNE